MLSSMTRFLISAAVLLFVSCASLIGYETALGDDRHMPEDAAYETSYFSSPRQAVEAIRKMQKAEDWTSLARYYDLDGSGIDRKSLISGEFFIRTERPAVSHPGGFWRYKHPFAPDFEYASSSPADKAGIVTVSVSISIDQGSGSPQRQGRQEFEMRQSDRGFQILPNTRDRIPDVPFKLEKFTR